MTASPNVTITPAPAAPASTPVKAELGALDRITDIMAALDPAAQRRTAAWVADKWGAA